MPLPPTEVSRIESALESARCQNCGASLTGPYCSACGQRAHIRIVSLGHLLQEAVEDIWHLDSRLWRTLRALALKPGFLTLEFLAGRRAGYVPPFRLYIVASILLFLLTSHYGREEEIVFDGSTQSLQNTISATQTALAAKRAEFARNPANVRLKAQVDDLSSDLDELRKLDVAKGSGGGTVCDRMTVEFFGWSGLEPRSRAACRKIAADRGAGLARAFVENLPKSMFLFLPLLALVNKLLYLRSRRYYVEHLLFFVHLHVFLFVAISAIVIGNAVLALVPGGVHPPEIVSVAIAIALLGYVYLSLRRVYGQGRVKTFIKFGILFCAYTMCLLVTTIVTFLYSALTL